jgi:hypothetical protein
LPLEFYEARNAVRIAKCAGADRYASDSYEKAVRQMNNADALAASKHENRKSLISVSCEVVQTAADAREISVKHMDEERAEGERRAGRGREAVANNRADDESQRRANAEAASAQADHERNEANRQNDNAQAAAELSAAAQADAERDRETGCFERLLEGGDDFSFFIRSEVFGVDFSPSLRVLEEFCSTRWKQGKIFQKRVLGQIGEKLFFKLRPVASGNHGDLSSAEESMQQGGHFRIQRGFTFGECAVQIEHN